MTAATSRWSPGQQVMASDNHRWRRAYIDQPRPMYHRSGRVIDGAYVRWADMTADDYRDASAGGWNFEIVEGWDDAAAALDALAFILRCVGDYAARRAARAAEVRS